MHIHLIFTHTDNIGLYTTHLYAMIDLLNNRQGLL